MSAVSDVPWPQVNLRTLCCPVSWWMTETLMSVNVLMKRRAAYQKKDLLVFKNSTLFETWGLEYLERRLSWRECYKTETGDVRSCDGRSVIKITMCLDGRKYHDAIQNVGVGYPRIHRYTYVREISCLSLCQAVVSTIPTGLSLVRTCIPSATTLLTEALLLNPAYG